MSTSATKKLNQQSWDIFRPMFKNFAAPKKTYILSPSIEGYWVLDIGYLEV